MIVAAVELLVEDAVFKSLLFRVEGSSGPLERHIVLILVVLMFERTDLSFRLFTLLVLARLVLEVFYLWGSQSRR